MDLSVVAGAKSVGITLDAMDPDVRLIVESLPDAYAALLETSNGIELSSGGIIYSADVLVEMNEVYELAQYMPAYWTIGDTGGGDAILLKKGSPSPVFMLGHGALGAMEPKELAPSLEAWIAQGCPLGVPD